MPRTWTVRRRSAWPLLLAWMLLVALLAPGRAHAAGWVGEQTVSTANNRAGQAPAPTVGVDGQGNALLAMVADKGPPQALQVATRAPGAAWSAAQELTTIAGTNTAPTLAVDSAGNAISAFTDSAVTASCTSGGASTCLHILFKPAGSSTWSTERTLNAPSGGGISNVQVALDPRATGNASVVFTTTPSAGVFWLYGMNRMAGAWSPVATVVVGGTGGESVALPRLAIDGNGRSITIWASAAAAATTTCPCGVKASLNFGSGTPIVPITQTTNVTGLSLSTNAQGGADAMWVTTAAGVGRNLQAAAIAAGAGSFGPTATVYTASTSTTIVGPRMVTASDGESVAAWTNDVSGVAVVRSLVANSRPAGGAWSAAAQLDGNIADASGPAVVMDAAGNSAVIWHSAFTSTVRSALHPHGGAFGAVFDGPATPAGTAAVAAASDPAGNIHAVWPTGAATVDTAVLDTAPPTMAALPAGLATPFVNSLVSFDATATDTWSNPVTIHWDFGDGNAADGGSVTHAYSLPGAYTARATASDTSGNSTSQTESLQAMPAASGLPRPVAGQTANLELVSGIVLVKAPGSNTFVPLVDPMQVANGSIIDARKGRVRITIDNGRGGLDTADFYGGVFRFTQPKVKAGLTSFANLYLYGGSFKGCLRAPRSPKVAIASKTQRGRRSIRHLWGSGQGAFRTVGRFSSATIRGTTWLTDDRCNGTLTKVTAGKVGVRDFVLKKTVLVRAHKSYFAQPKKK